VNHPLQSNGPEGRIAPGLALIFDMDGVIVDSNPVHREAWVAYNRRFGLETTESMHEFMYGRRNDEIVRGFYGDALSGEEVARRGAEKERLYREMIGGRVDEILAPGLRPFLARLSGAPLAVATNAEPDNVDFVLERAGIRDCFQAVVDGHQVPRPKPFPDVYLMAAGRLGTAPADCIVFEDSYTGVEAARRAGMRVIGVRTTHRDLPADLLIDDFLSANLEPWLAAQPRAA
jgi:beta-phosphoglucomutase